ncbi:glycosyl transferase [Aureimonas sp. SA4125]|uniref:glycosyltransferase family 4 protein n=1 Tax=Aureimonas sp. SA4125 TaxID=2826993 RepID=UPI001CC4B935|nr:glycosyltransferase family 4 protein [Aureimonas sp. SA4125]BDA82952.1 glycosyl transferase [Aureimonas sp. SA4125]
MSRRICIVLTGLQAGGTERVVNVLANEWVPRGWAVTVVTFEPASAAPYYRFHPSVEIRNLALPPSRQSALWAVLATARRVRHLRRAFQDIRPDIVFSFLTRTNVTSLIAASGLGMKVVVSERNNSALQDVGYIWNWMRARLYPRAFGLVTMTRESLALFPAGTFRRSWVIANAVELPTDGERRRGANILTAVGRLVPQKGFDMLLRAFAEISADFPEWRLVIWGEGEERAALEAERSRLGLDCRVEFPGVTPRPGAWVETADVFVLSSRFEGWGIVLLEAMAADLPVVSFDCDFGPREMIEDQKNGLLVAPNDVSALAKALARVLGDEHLRARLGQAAGTTARQFTPRRMVDQWDAVAYEALDHSPHSR